MNRIKTDWCFCLNTETMERLIMRISVDDIPIGDFDPHHAGVILQEADDPMLPNTKQLLHKNSFISLINHLYLMFYKSLSYLKKLIN